MSFSIQAVFILFLTTALPLKALELGLAKEDAGQAGRFLTQAANARSLGLGSAYVAVADDASAPFWNPAGLSQVERKDVVAMYSSLELDTNYGLFGYAQPALNSGTFGLGIVSLRSGGFDKRSGPGISDRQGSFSVNQSAVLLSHGIRLNPKWSLGETLKVVREEIDRYSGTSFGLDLGLMLRINQKWQAGFVFRNFITPRMKLKNSKDVYPREIRTGVQWAPLRKWTFTSDVYLVEKNQAKLNLGAEWRPVKMISLRTGLNDTEITAGLGFQIGDWDLDYAFGLNTAAPQGTEEFNRSHKFGIHCRFGKNISSEEMALNWQRKGQDALMALEKYMESDILPAPEAISSILETAKQALEHKGYPDPLDLYRAQGYMNFFERKYDKSTYFLSEALLLAGSNSVLEKHYQEAKALMTHEQTQSFADGEMKKIKESFGKGDYRGVLTSCERILSLDPNHIEAKTYQEIAQKRIREPVDLAIRIAKAKIERGHFLEAIKNLTEVQKYDPANATAAELMKEAIRRLEGTQTNSPEEPRVVEVSEDQTKSREFYSQGLIMYSKGDLRGAVKAWEASLQYNGTNQAARNAYNRALVELKDNPQ